MTTLNSLSALATLAASAAAAGKSVFSGRVTFIKHYPESTSVLVRVVAKNGKTIPGLKDGLIVDIRMSKEKHDQYALETGLARSAQVAFQAYDIAAHQPRTASNKNGDRSLPPKKDANGNAIEGTATPIHRILELVPDSFTVELGAKGCTGPLTLPEDMVVSDSVTEIVNEGLTSVVPQTPEAAPLLQGLAEALDQQVTG